ncbi:MAG: serine/threonine protein phosphatase [Bacteroidales bacterium]|nr:serine/threonine protein phosphatase [Bacteroidales bacterium]
MSTWAIADIHGCYFTFKQLVEDKLQISPSDKVYLLGDMVDRGPHIKELLDYILLLQEKGYQIMPVKGNHEYFLCRAYQIEQSGKTKHWWNRSALKYIHSWQTTGGAYTLNSFGVQHAALIPEHYIQWMLSLPCYYITPHAILTHAGLNCRAASPFEDTDTLLLGTSNCYTPQFLNGKYVIHGHNAISMEGIVSMLNNINKHLYLCIDNGCVYAGRRPNCGHLMALDLDNFTFEKQIYIE